MELIDRCGLLNKIPAVNPSKDEKVSRCGATRDMMLLVMSVPTVDPVNAAGGVYCHECVNKNCCRIEELFIEMEIEQGLRFCGCGEKYEDLPE